VLCALLYAMQFAPQLVTRNSQHSEACDLSSNQIDLEALRTEIAEMGLEEEWQKLKFD
jgi:hypothetical protein